MIFMQRNQFILFPPTFPFDPLEVKTLKYLSKVLPSTIPFDPSFTNSLFFQEHLRASTQQIIHLKYCLFP
jgi:hypothetical protein